MKGGQEMTESYGELIEGRVFIGGAAEAMSAAEAERVDVVIDLRAEAEDGEFDYNRIHSPIIDDTDQEQDESIKKAINRVVDAYKENKKVYFHCAGGSNRTGTVAIGTLLALGKAETIEEAEETAASARPKINVKPPFKESLRRIFPEA